MEEISRVLFLLREESNTQTTRISQMRTKNEQLVYNILPVHVAKDFAGGKQNEMVCNSLIKDKCENCTTLIPEGNSYSNHRISQKWCNKYSDVSFRFRQESRQGASV